MIDQQTGRLYKLPILMILLAALISAAAVTNASKLSASSFFTSAIVNPFTRSEQTNIDLFAEIACHDFQHPCVEEQVHLQLTTPCELSADDEKFRVFTATLLSYQSRSDPNPVSSEITLTRVDPTSLLYSAVFPVRTNVPSNNFSLSIPLMSDVVSWCLEHYNPLSTSLLPAVTTIDLTYQNEKKTLRSWLLTDLIGSKDHPNTFSHANLLLPEPTTDQSTISLDVNFFFEDIKPTLLGFIIKPLNFRISIIPTGSFQQLLADSAQSPTPLITMTQFTAFGTTFSSPLPTEIDPDPTTPSRFSIETDPDTGLIYFQINVSQPAINSLYYNNRGVSDQSSFSCTLNFPKEFALQYVAPLLQARQDWSFVPVIRSPLCDATSLFVVTGCDYIMPFSQKPKQNKQTNLELTELTPNFTYSNLLHVGTNASDRTLPYSTIYQGEVRSVAKLFRFVQTSKKIPNPDDPTSTTTITILRSFLTYTTPIPEAFWFKETIISPAKAELAIFVASVANEALQDVSYSISCLGKESTQKGLPTPTTYIRGNFAIDKPFTHPLNPFVISTKASVLKDSEQQILEFPSSADPTSLLSCSLQVEIVLDDASEKHSRVNLVPTVQLISSIPRTSHESLTSNLLQDDPVVVQKSVFEAAFDVPTGATSPFGGVSNRPLKVKTSSKSDHRHSFTVELFYDNYNKLTSFYMDLVGSGYEFSIQKDSSGECSFTSFENFSRTYKSVKATVINTKSLFFPLDDALVAGDTVQFTCSGIDFTSLDENSTSEPLITITTGSNDQRFAGYLLGPDAIAAAIDPRFKRMLMLIGGAVVVGIILAITLFCVIRACCCQKKPTVAMEQSSTAVNAVKRKEPTGKLKTRTSNPIHDPLITEYDGYGEAV